VSQAVRRLLESLTEDNLLIYFGIYGFVIGIGLLAIILPILRWRKRNLSFLLFFSIFWVYLLFVIRTVVFPIAINQAPFTGSFSPDINLIPFYIRYCSPMTKYCFIEVVGNTILTIPFGFGINFLARFKSRNILWIAICVGFGFEFLQLIISLIFRTGFRAVDINDALLNSLGLLFGYALFRIFAWAYIKIFSHSKTRENWLFADIYDIAFRAQFSERPENA
jgi:glycopeptide antibiotics resistance protein